MKEFKGHVEIRDEGGRRVKYPVSVQACDWDTASRRAARFAKDTFKQNRQGRRALIKNMIVDITFIMDLGGSEVDDDV